MYVVIKYCYKKECPVFTSLHPVYMRGFDSMHDAMVFTKEKIRKDIIDYGYEEGRFVMLDSADDEAISYPYYSFEVTEDGDIDSKVYRYDVIVFSDGNIVYL